ncbi:MAG: hypothetical protein AAFR89_14425, partial [Cyanobacteria bacterium J06633_1]
QSSEQARNEVFRILSQPRQASAFWGQFKRSVVNVSQQVERDRALGVSNPHTPVWTRERIEPSIEEAAAAGDKIRSVNGTIQAAIEAARNLQLEGKNCSLPQSHDLPVSDPDPTTDPWVEGDCEASRRHREKPNLKEMLAQRKIKGFVRAMPQVSKSEAAAEARAESCASKQQQMNRKTHISQMSLAEINELLTDPIIRKELTP